jgi:ribosome-binding ATPase YchF (GTP1/OBG family)
VSYADVISAGSLSQARNNNKISLENKEYIVRDGDYIVFKCNK